LSGSVAEKRVLQAVKDGGAGWQALNGGDGLAFHLAHCHEAGADRLAFDENRARAAVTGIAADFGSGQA
jgi:hypothetical protein